MKRIFAGVLMLLLLCSVAAFAGFTTKIYMTDGGDRQVVDSGGEIEVKTGGTIDVESGGNFKLAGTAVTSSAVELNYTDVAAGTATASKALVLDSSKRAVGMVRYIETIADDDTLTAADYGKIFVFKGVSGKKKVTLADAAAGAEFTFIVDDTDSLQVTILGDDDKIVDGTTETDTVAMPAGSFTVACVDTSYYHITSKVGTLTGY